MYGVYICFEGTWQAVWVDDYFPCYKNTGPIFCRSKEQELWVMILEKAWAKINGSYGNIVAG
jgi:calpain-15